MKTKQLIIILALVVVLSVISSQTVVAYQPVEKKDTPPGLENKDTPPGLEKKDTPPGLEKKTGSDAAQKNEEKAERAIGNPHGKHENYKGTITAVDTGSITLALKDGSSITIVLVAETRIHIPKNKEATVLELTEGMTVMVQALRGQDESLTARKVIVVPGKPTKTHRVGIITDYVEGVSITIQAKDELLYTFLLTEETKILPVERLDQLKIGARVTVIAPRDVSTLDQTATGIVVHPPVVEE